MIEFGFNIELIVIKLMINLWLNYSKKNNQKQSKNGLNKARYVIVTHFLLHIKFCLIATLPQALKFILFKVFSTARR